MCKTAIDEFVMLQKRNYTTDGIVICGSYTQGRYGAGSDIDIIFLTPIEQKLEARHITYKKVKFHRLLANAHQLWQFLVSATQDPFAIAVLHSLSVQVQVVEDSAALRELIKNAKIRVKEWGIAYNPQEREVIIMHQQRYRITKPDGQWRLEPVNPDDGEI